MRLELYNIRSLQKLLYGEKNKKTKQNENKQTERVRKSLWISAGSLCSQWFWEETVHWDTIAEQWVSSPLLQPTMLWVLTTLLLSFDHMWVGPCSLSSKQKSPASLEGKSNRYPLWMIRESLLPGYICEQLVAMAMARV